jgi:hypothetical protein
MGRVKKRMKEFGRGKGKRKDTRKRREGNS